VDATVACSAERNQIVFNVVAGLAAKLFVMNLKIRHRSTELAPPAVPAQHLIAKLIVEHRV